MSTLAYPYEVRDSANVSTDNRKTGLTPTVSDGKTLAASPATVTASGNVTVVEVGAGIYIASYDAEANGDAAFPVDWGSSLPNPNDRYGSLVLTRDSARLLAAITGGGDLAGKLLGGGSGSITGIGANVNATQVGGQTATPEDDADPVTAILTSAYDAAKTAAQPGAAMTLTSAGLDGITAETGVNLRQAVALILDAVLAVLSGANTTTVTVKNPAGNATRAVVTVDSDNNRTAVTLTPPA